MKKIFPLFALLLLSACDTIHYDGETKLVIKGVIVDENNQPISNNEVKLVVSVSGEESFIFGSGSESNYIGRTISKPDGSYTMVIPKPSNFGQIAVQTNSPGNQLNSKEFVNIQLSNFVNYELVLPQTKLYQKANLTSLNITLNQVNPNSVLQKIEYIGAVANENEMINPYEENYPFDTYVQVRKNQTLIVKYTIKNTNTYTTQVLEENIPIGTEPQINYTLNY